MAIYLPLYPHNLEVAATDRVHRARSDQNLEATKRPATVVKLFAHRPISTTSKQQPLIVSPDLEATKTLKQLSAQRRWYGYSHTTLSPKVMLVRIFDHRFFFIPETCVVLIHERQFYGYEKQLSVQRRWYDYSPTTLSPEF